ncbi:sec63 brl domain-containing protein [Phthorimaea operculella]|nr:sec63 brl domain-containing protein [Phthorimaea operculella]
MDEASCIESTEAGRLMSVYYLDLETMKHIMKVSLFLISNGLITMDEASCIESTEAGRLMSVYYLDLETMKHIMKVSLFLISNGLITMDEASCIESTEAGRLMSVYYLDLETMKHIMKIEGTETLEKLLWIVCESHELADMHLRVDERRVLNALNRNNAAATIRFPMKGKISTRQMKLNCLIQAILGCLPIPEPSLNQEAMKVMRTADRVCKCLVAYVTRPDLISNQTQYFTAIVNAIILAKCIEAHLWENSPYVSKQLKGIGPTFSTLLATAGKVNFTLLEESHPRDLERIMNKGAPAGNVLRKQVSLLPKYQITATPIDEKRISIQLLLLNQHQLAENRDQLTAGDSHRCYVVVGDSENYLLLFATFKDKDLIHMYDGTLTYEVTRKHNYEHRILIHCISSNWVGVDVHCEYLFKNIEPPFLRGEAIHPIPIENLIEHTPRKTPKRQTSITDVYKERKRKSNEIDITESKEKKKRDTALVEKFKLLKNSFEVTSKELREDLAKSAEMSNMIIGRMTLPDQEINMNETNFRDHFGNNAIHPAAGCDVIDIDDNGTFGNSRHVTADHENKYAILDTIDLDDEDNFVVDDHINSIMNEIESDILKTNNPQNSANVNTHMNTSRNDVPTKPVKVESSFFIKPAPNFMDTIEKKVSLDDDIEVPQKDSGFSDTIKSQIEKFLQSTTKPKRHDVTIERLLNGTDNEFSESINMCPNTKTENVTSSESPTISLSSELPAVFGDNKNNQDMLEIPPETTYPMKKDTELVKREIATNTENIDKIVQEIEREYNNLANKQVEENAYIDLEIIPKPTEFPDRKENEIINFENVIHKHDTNTPNADRGSEVSSRDVIDNADYTKKPDQGNASEKQVVVEHPDLLTNNPVDVIESRTVVSSNNISKCLDYDVNKFREPYPINMIRSTNISTNDNAMKSKNDITINNTPSTPKEPVPDGKATEAIETGRFYTKVRSPNQNDDDNEKIAENKQIMSNYDDGAYATVKQVVKHRGTNNCLNVLTNKRVVPLIAIPKSLEFDVDKFSKHYSINTMPKNIATTDNHTTKINRDICRNFNLDSMTQYRPSTSKELLPRGEAAEINATEQVYDYVRSQNQINEDKIKDPGNSYIIPDCDDRASTKFNENENPNYINRYSFSATKIDVSTKNLPDHQVQIIRKLKVDLDVTEIVSKGNNREYANRPEMGRGDNEYHKTDETEGAKPKQLEQCYAASIDTTNILKHLNRENDLSVREDNTFKQQTEITKTNVKQCFTHAPTRPIMFSSLGIEYKDNNNNVPTTKTDTDTRNCYLRPDKHIFQAIEGNYSSGVHLSLTNATNERAKQRKNEITNTEIITSPRKEVQDADKQKNIEIEQYKKYLRDIAGAKRLIEKSADNTTSETKEKITSDKTYLVAESADSKNIEQCKVIKSKGVDNIPSESEDKITPQAVCLAAKSSNIEQSNGTKVNKIDNILHKYSAILRKNNCHFNNNTVNNNPSNNDVVRPPPEKPKKAYKISDIQNLRIPLPKNLITVEASRTPKYSNDDTAPRVKEHEDNNTQRERENAQLEAITNNNPIECIPENIPDDIPEYVSPEIVNSNDQEEITTGFDLDQSMLNPKLLLEQCFTKTESNDDELIIPPPSDFCDDENTYSPVQLEETTLQDYNETEQGGTSNYDHDKSIFEDDNNSVLTPSVEIETWTLSKDDEEICDRDFRKQRHLLYNEGMPQKIGGSSDNFHLVRNRRNNTNKSCTVLRRNLNISTDLSSPSQDFEINSRQEGAGRGAGAHDQPLLFVRRHSQVQDNTSELVTKQRSEQFLNKTKLAENIVSV